MSGGILPCDLFRGASDVATPHGQNDLEMPVKTLPSPKFVCWR